MKIVKTVKSLSADELASELTQILNTHPNSELHGSPFVETNLTSNYYVQFIIFNKDIQTSPE